MLKRKFSQKEKTERIYQLHNLFMELWKKLSSPRKCTSCGQRIWGECLSIYFDHLLPKNKYPEFEFEEKNIYFCCVKCHSKKENGFPTEKHRESIEKVKQELLTDK